MPTLNLPATEPETIKIVSFSKGTPRHVRAIAKYLYERVPANVVSTLFFALFPHLTTEQLQNIMSVRLRKLSMMTLKEIDEIQKGREE